MIWRPVPLANHRRQPWSWRNTMWPDRSFIQVYGGSGRFHNLSVQITARDSVGDSWVRGRHHELLKMRFVLFCFLCANKSSNCSCHFPTINVFGRFPHVQSSWLGSQESARHRRREWPHHSCGHLAKLGRDCCRMTLVLGAPFLPFLGSSCVLLADPSGAQNY